jgi:hypothetical protein
MNIEKAFKALIQIYLVTIIAVFVGAFNESTEVNQINENISSGFMGVNEATEFVFSIIFIIFIIVFFISLYFIYKFKKLGKKLYTICFIIGSGIRTLCHGCNKYFYFRVKHRSLRSNTCVFIFHTNK